MDGMVETFSDDDANLSEAIQQQDDYYPTNLDEWVNEIPENAQTSDPINHNGCGSKEPDSVQNAHPANLNGRGIEKKKKAQNEDPGNLCDNGSANLLNSTTDSSGKQQEEQLKSKDREAEHHNNLERKCAEERWPGWPGNNVFRILIPNDKVGAVIGRKGELIRRTCEETGARIKILDGLPGVLERVGLISAKEEPDMPISPAMDGLLRVHKIIINGSDADLGTAQRVDHAKTRLLVPLTQARFLIGKQGSTIKSIQEESGCIIRIVENTPPFVLHEDRVIEIQGDPSGSQKAVRLIMDQLRKYLVDQSVIPLFEIPIVNQDILRPPPQLPPQQPWGAHQAQPWGYLHNLPSPGGLPFGCNPAYMPPPPRPTAIFYPTSDIPPVEQKPPHHGISTYGQDMNPTSDSVNRQTLYGVSQITHSMQVPLSYADYVIGAAGSNISYIRRASGATVTIQESRSTPGEMTVEIIGSATQVQTAQQLIQNSLAEAEAPAPALTQPAPAEATTASYNSYDSSHSYGGAPSGGSGHGHYNGAGYNHYSGS